jgi:hypothetical protein
MHYPNVQLYINCVPLVYVVINQGEIFLIDFARYM